MPSPISKKQLFNDKAIMRILGNLIRDDQLEFETYLWILRAVYFQVLIKSPAEFIRVLKELLNESPVSYIVKALISGGWDKRLYPKYESESKTKETEESNGVPTRQIP